MPNPTKHNDTKHLLFDVLLGVCGCSRVCYGISRQRRLCTYVRALRNVLTASETWGKPRKLSKVQWGNAPSVVHTKPTMRRQVVDWFNLICPLLSQEVSAKPPNEEQQKHAEQTCTLCLKKTLHWLSDLFERTLQSELHRPYMPLVTQALRSTEFDWSAPITAPTWKPLEPKVWPAEPDRAQGDHGQNSLKYHQNDVCVCVDRSKISDNWRRTSSAFLALRQLDLLDWLLLA